MIRGSLKYLAVPGKDKQASAASPEAIAALKALAEQGAGRDFVATSSGALATRLGVSQQTASRKILELLDLGLVQRRMATRAQLLKVTPKGLDLLRREFEALRSILEGGGADGGTLRLAGKVSTGMGEGGWYISRRGYQAALERLLGFRPYYGTLNVTLDGPEAAKLAELRAHEGMLVPEFQDEGRTFGAVKCFRARLRGIEAGAVFPLRGHHTDVLEVVAPVHLRDRLGLRDGDDVAIEVQVA